MPDRPVVGVQLGWYLIAILAALASGFIWLGTLSNQIAVNTARLDRVESFDNEVRQHDADTTARLTPIERRIDQLENWQQAVKRGQ